MSIKNVVFDVGMVLLDFRYREYMKDLGIPEDKIDELSEKMVLSDFWSKLDKGAEREEDAPDYFKGLMPEHSEYIDLFWKDLSGIIEIYPYSDPMIRGLKKAGYNVYLLSNYPLHMSELHWPTFPFMECLDGYIISSKEKMIKPDREIYDLFLTRYNLKAEETVFLDDRKINIDAAKNIGMEGIVFTGYENAVEELKKLGVNF